MTYRHKKKKRIRSIAAIEAEIATHEERYRKHLLWKERNEHFSRRREHYCSEIEKQISQIKNSESSYKKKFGLFQTRDLTTEASQKLSHLEIQLSEAEKKAFVEVPVLDFPYEQYPNNRCMYSDWTIIPTFFLKRELAQAKEKEAKKEKQRAITARVAKADGKTRELAISVKPRLSQDHPCPYCGNGLGDNCHADHIYPVSRGGLSTSVNMVYVCADCNTKKRDKTLRKFIEEFGLDRMQIEERLNKLGKEF